MALQAMIIVAWTQSGSTSANNEVVLRRVLSIFITYAILSFLRAILDVILSIRAWRNSDLTQPLRYLLKLVVAAIWAVVLPVGYSTSVKNPTGPLKFLNHWARDSHNQSLYNYILVLYMIPDLLAITLFLLPRLREKMELSDWPVINIVMWWAQVHNILDIGAKCQASIQLLCGVGTFIPQSGSIILLLACIATSH
ncbi:Putative callose synthase 6 -like protein [Gossypium arboreum]|uniref:Putative callose synthase 6-like protein n=1 Tax=Gossypium arboreum TaxID=29729 RepID=A0A0B0NT80_GOSAR|nr:Putative callose synthase 6 -like protein [Gossypium arboreum]